MLDSSIWGRYRHFTSLFSAAVFLLITAGQSAFAGTYTVLSPQGFQRQTGAPITESVSFPVKNATGTFTINIYNGGLDDHELTGEIVSSSTITLNGIQIFGPNEFNKNVTTLSKAISLQNDNELSVQLKGKPGGVITLTVTGEDTDLPTIAATLSSVANGAGWHNDDITVNFDCNDATSGIASCPSPVHVTSEGINQVINGLAIDRAGNEATTSVSLNLDKTPPALQFVSPQAGEVVSSWQPSISISVSDNFEIDLSSLGVLLDGAAFDGSCNFDLGTVTCQPNSDLPVGIINLEASLADIAGNIGSAQLSFQIEPDSDGDGVPDSEDAFPDDPNESADSDSDGVGDMSDQCPSSPPGESVNATGCAPSELDSDGDGVSDDADQCPGTPAGINVDNAGCPIVLGDDSDGDNIQDSIDNCPTIFNPDQADSNGDGTGDACEPVGNITITSPAAGQIINSSTISVTGTFDGPSGSGVLVNSRQACVHQNQFVINNVPINSGDHVLSAQIIPSTGIGAFDQITVNRSGDSLFDTELNSNCVVAPFEAKFSLENIDASILQIGVDYDGDGSTDEVISDFTLPVATHTYTEPGMYKISLTGVDANGNNHEQSLNLVVQDGAVIDAEVQIRWQNIVTGLSDNNVTQVLNEMTPNAQEKYGPVFDALQNDLSTIVSSFSELQPVDINADYAEYAINRVIQGENRVFLIYFIKDESGNWKLESM